MCGIVGFVSTQDNVGPTVKRHFMRFALALDTLRGEDSTGLFTVSRGGQVKVKHSLMPGDKWVAGKAFQNVDLDVCFAVGHNRAATKGKVTIQNVHPFTFGDVTLVHNGTLNDNGFSIKSYDKTLEVDSMQIALGLSTVEPNKATEVLSQINGAYALVWYDARDRSLNFARNSGRPMHMCWNNQRDIMWFMSDGAHLSAVNKGMIKSSLSGSTVYSIDTLHHVKFTLGQQNKPHVKKFKEYVRPVYSGDMYGGIKSAVSNWKNKVDKYKGNSESNASVVRVEVNDKKRTVPLAQQLAVKEMYGVSIDRNLEFKPEFSIDHAHSKKKIVVGKVVLEDWGGTDWPAIIHNVPMVQANAYMDCSWLIKPVGMGKPIDPDNFDVPTMLCHLMHCSWEKYAKFLKEEQEKIEKEENKAVDLVVPGPEGEMLKRSTLQRLMDSGCIQCNEQIPLDEITAAVYANERRDILCRGCQHDINTGWQQHLLTHASKVH